MDSEKSENDFKIGHIIYFYISAVLCLPFKDALRIHSQPKVKDDEDFSTS